MIIPFQGTKQQDNNIQVNDVVKFVNRNFSDMPSKGIVLEVNDDYVVVKVSEGIFNNCRFNISKDDCKVIQRVI